YLELSPRGKQNFSLACRTHGSEQARENVWLWHRRLGHLSFGYLKKLQPSLFLNLHISEFQCDICELAKNHRVPHFPSLNKCSEPFMVIHSDIWGPAKVPSISKARYFVTFIDECTRMTWVSLLYKKSDAHIAFQEFFNMVHTQYQRRIRI